ncbi:four-carbon acid sugar kinase family protein [Actinoplanes sp. NBC_00393]|uniref:four-carbon acid sugar kinase family protein n=1 Tax=Actinoplanes sp. NBC_00393 TaxID=2975953 RepID=UPI002E2322E3
MTPRMLGLVADDLTGATDAAVPFAAAGWSAHLLRSSTAAPSPAGDRPCLLAVATGVRAAADDRATAVTAAAVGELLARGCDRLYLKVDSTMRGSVAAQIRGALGAWAQAYPGAVVVVCPAFPEQGRTVVGGRVLVRGIPLEHTAAAQDPVTPVTTSLLSDLVAGLPASEAGSDADLARGLVALDADLLRGLSAPEADLLRGLSAPEADLLRGLSAPDAGSDADLDEIAATLDRHGPGAVAAGSAGLASALARRWPAAKPAPDRQRPSTCILVGVSSLHPVALSALARLRDARPTVDVITTPAARADAATTAAGFGEQVAHQLKQARYDTVVLVGGDGAAAALDHVDAGAITVHRALAPGVPLGTICGGAAHGVRVVTTSGGFGSADSLVDIVDRLGTTGGNTR